MSGPRRLAAWLALSTVSIVAGAAQPPTDVVWKLRTTLTAGEDPGQETVDLDSAGRIAIENNVLNLRCEATLTIAQRRDIERAVDHVEPANWRTAYFPRENPAGRGELQMVVEVVRSKGPARPVASNTRWLIATRTEAPPDAVALWDAVWAARRFCLAVP